MATLRRSDVSAVLDFLDDVESVSDESDEIVTETVLTGVAKVVPSDTVWRAECDYARHSNKMLSSDRRLGPAYEAKQERWWQLHEEHPIRRTAIARATNEQSRSPTSRVEGCYVDSRSTTSSFTRSASSIR